MRVVLSLNRRAALSEVTIITSEAIHPPHNGSSYPRRRVSSTPRLIGSIMDASGILDHPPSRVMTTECVFVFSRRIAPEFFHEPRRPSRKEGAGNAGCLLHPRSRVQDVDRCAHEHTGTAGALRHSLRNGLTAYGALSPETNSSCLRRRRIDGPHCPVGRLQTSADLTPATGARTTRFCRTQPRQSSARCVRSRTKARPANTTTRPTLPRPPQPAPTFVTMANAPLPGRDGGSCRGDLGLARRSLFLRARLDRANHVEVATENQFFAHVCVFARRAEIAGRQEPRVKACHPWPQSAARLSLVR